MTDPSNRKTLAADMKSPALILLVRFKSALSMEEITRVMHERAPDFRALPGLQQKYYMRDAATGEVAGLYLWESKEAFDDYRNSELRATIAKAYRAEGEPRIEVYDVLMPLRTE
ncbi:MAG: YdhR family protein [Planctomycetota bacterium]